MLTYLLSRVFDLWKWVAAAGRDMVCSLESPNKLKNSTENLESTPVKPSTEGYEITTPDPAIRGVEGAREAMARWTSVVTRVSQGVWGYEKMSGWQWPAFFNGLSGWQLTGSH